MTVFIMIIISLIFMMNLRDKKEKKIIANLFSEFWVYSAKVNSEGYQNMARFQYGLSLIEKETIEHEQFERLRNNLYEMIYNSLNQNKFEGIYHKYNAEGILYMALDYVGISRKQCFFAYSSSTEINRRNEVVIFLDGKLLVHENVNDLIKRFKGAERIEYLNYLNQKIVAEKT